MSFLFLHYFLTFFWRMTYTLIINVWLDKFLHIDIPNFLISWSIWNPVRTVWVLDVYILGIYLISLVILIIAIVMGCICFLVLIVISLMTNDVTHIFIGLLDNLWLYFIQIHLLHGYNFLFTVLLLSFDEQRLFFYFSFMVSAFWILIKKSITIPRLWICYPRFFSSSHLFYL